MSKSRMRERIFAGLGAGLFLVIAVGTVVLTVIDSRSANNQTTATPDASTCQSTETVAKIDAPQPFKPEGDVTELQVTDVTAGDGAEAKAGDCLVVKYYGTLTDGTRFDDNFTTDQAFAFTLGGGQVIQGWDQGLVGLKEGGTRRLVIPASLGYGDQASGSIPANSPLIFEVKLLSIK